MHTHPIHAAAAAEPPVRAVPNAADVLIEMFRSWAQAHRDLARELENVCDGLLAETQGMVTQ